MGKATVRVSILIKALNEEARIGDCLAAAVREARSINGEVILVDSLSTDRTVEIASRYPVRIVQFFRLEDCGCGAAVQLGYQFAKGDYIYVSGKLVDTHIRTAADARRAQTVGNLSERTEVDHLGGGGLYRGEAIESVGYLAHRWLPALEEAELGFRLHAAGWRLVRLPDVAVLHTGHAESSREMLRRLWRNRRAHAGGMFLRSAFRKAWWWLTVRNQWRYFLHLRYISRS